MSFWWREFSGWLLIGVGFLFFVLAYQFCLVHYLTEAWPMAIIGIAVFWGGVQLLKVAIAARVCQQTQDRLYPARGVQKRQP
jgi:hypothetical protein